MNEKMKVKRGDLFVTSWGYDQTQYNFVIVDKVSPTGKTAMCRMACGKTVSSSLMYSEREPTMNGFGLPFRMKVETSRYDETQPEKVYLRGSYPFLNRWDGDNWNEEQKNNWLASKRLDTFSRHETGRSYSETNSQFGH